MVLIEEIAEEPEKIVSSVVAKDDDNTEAFKTGKEGNELGTSSMVANSEVGEPSNSDHHGHERYSLEEDIHILNYVHQFTHDPEIEGLVEKFRGPAPNTNRFWQGYVTASGTLRSAHNLYTRWPRLVRRMHTMPIETEAKLDIYYSLDIPIHEDFIETVRKEANFAMDSERKLEAFEMKSIEQIQREMAQELKKKTPKKPRKPRTSQVANTPNERKSLSNSTKKPATVKRTNKKTSQGTGAASPAEQSTASDTPASATKQSAKRSKKDVRASISTADQSSSTPAKNKAAKRRASKITSNQVAADTQQTPSTVQDSKKANEQSDAPEVSEKVPPVKKAKKSIANQVNQIAIDGDSSEKQSRTKFDEAEDVKMWEFLLSKITDPDTQLIQKTGTLKFKSITLWKEYLGNDADNAKSISYSKHAAVIAKHLHKMPFSNRMKIDLYYGLGIPVDPGFLTMIRGEGFIVRTDESGCIDEYNSIESDEDKRVRVY